MHICAYIYICNKEKQKGVNEIKYKTPKRYSQPSSRGHCEYRVRMSSQMVPFPPPLSPRARFLE